MGGPFRPFDSGECAALEREIGLPLPPAYCSFLASAGGEMLDYSIRLPACDPEPVQSFDNVPLIGLLPVARNGDNDILFLDLNPATYGQLHAFVHAIPWPGYLGNHVFTKVADTFDAYLDSLFIDPDTAQDAWADVADSDPSDPWRRTVEEWLDRELPAWRAEAWATT